MVLSDNDILLAKQEGSISIKPFRKGNLRPSSYELHLGTSVMFYDVNSQEESVIDLKESVEDKMAVEVISKEYGAFIPPGGFIIAGAEETIELDEYYTARVSGLYSDDSIGLFIKTSDEIVEPGMKTRVVFEIQNVSPCSIKIYPGMPIARITFEELKTPSGLSGKGSGKDSPIPSEIHKWFKK